MLTIRGLTVRIAGRTLIDGASIQIPTGHTVGLVGRNGTGKSTLLRVISGEITPDAGDVQVPQNARVGWVRQDMPDARATPLEFVLDADVERRGLLAEAETASDPARIAEVHARLADIRADAAPARASRVLAGLGFDEAMQARPLGSFSGGWRMRVALAATLFLEPDVLLLDEPSNHLDLETRVWLEQHLQRYAGTILLVSHDRGLLNACCDGILHLEQTRLTLYRGDYDTFERVRRERAERQAALAEAQARRRVEIQAFVDRFRAKATKARQAQSRLKMLERMEEIQPLIEDPDVRFDFPSPAQLAPPLVVLDQTDAGYGDTIILRRLDLVLGPEDRIALLGANGNGKTTLLRLIQGELDPLAGEVRRAAKLRVGYFEQEQAEAFDPEETTLTVASRVMGRPPETRVRAHLGRFGLVQDKATTRIGDLSGGEKARLLFALVTLDAPHVLLLDEPTNHLDIQAREALVEAINAFEGAVVLVSHDPYLIEATADRLWLVRDGTCRPFDGDLDDYRTLLREERRSNNENTASSARPAEERRGVRQARATTRAETADARQAARKAERDLEMLTAERRRLEARLADPALYAESPGDIEAVQKRLARVNAAIEAAEARWLAAAESLEAGGSAA